MKRLDRFVLLAISLLITFIAPLPVRAQIDAQVNAVLRDKLLSHAQASIEIVRLGNTAADTKVLYRHDSDIPMVPASNLKVLTTSASLDRLGPDFKFRTKLVFHNGSLILIGDGDPTFGDAELLSRVGWDVNTVFKNWAVALKQMKLPDVKNIVVDDSIFDSNFIHPHWPIDQLQKRYMAEVSGMNLNANCLDIYVRTAAPGQIVMALMDPSTQYVHFENTCITGSENAVWLSRQGETNDVVMRGQARVSSDVPVSVTIHDPPLFAATVLAENLSAAGIKHSGDVHRDRTIRGQLSKALADGDKSWMVLAIHETSIEQAMARANKDSMNLYAECLCKRLGAQTTGQSGSWENGTAAVAAFLEKIGVSENEFKLDDGCGLSKENQVSASAMVKVLGYDFFNTRSKIFVSTLAVAGTDGTLLDRFRGTDLRGRVFAKTGFVNGVRCLSGYLHARDNQWYAFSMLLNGLPDKSKTGVEALEDKIVHALDSDAASVASR
jgi:D-alanyl-D-alanine carboxypeptidase/D-alanyl-D-alanine-endopeptidase (penicillin-binding protein 4)